MTYPVVILGGGGHARVLMEALSRQSISLLGVADMNKPAWLPEGVGWLGDDEAVLNLDRNSIRLINGLGSVQSTGARGELYERFSKMGFRFASVIHPAAMLSRQCLQLGEGVQVLAGAVINSHSDIGNNVLINSGSIIEHDCRIGAHTHVASGATVCGGCDVGEGVHIGAGSTIIQGIRIGAGAIIAAGSVVIKDVKSMTMVAGVPGELKRTLHDD